jgi:hypothetical protein
VTALQNNVEGLIRLRGGKAMRNEVFVCVSLHANIARLAEQVVNL